MQGPYTDDSLNLKWWRARAWLSGRGKPVVKVPWPRPPKIHTDAEIAAAIKAPAAAAAGGPHPAYSQTLGPTQAGMLGSLGLIGSLLGN